MYGFRKVKCKEHRQCFAHSKFKRGAKHLLARIKRNAKDAGDEHEYETDRIFNTIQLLNERVLRLETRDKRFDSILEEHKAMRERSKELEEAVRDMELLKIRISQELLIKQHIGDNPNDFLTCSNTSAGTSEKIPGHSLNSLSAKAFIKQDWEESCWASVKECDEGVEETFSLKQAFLLARENVKLTESFDSSFNLGIESDKEFDCLKKMD